ncbi:MarR family winged helix-turn-helix transcriptional regulator [Haloplasma contractile]|uniref:NADH dehydrogenase I subunit C-D protein n=1 Tax=Haloplasma contractile SSD-17B TaxID=1033810 RepID=U2DUR4_9MOLU|nr:MarR family transcriptional regulator [Haloplasma contractile]ERJ12147.1 NADH dehydrogenase I subunit C-D protein [Haloplasma contractile SSD-17B]
MEQMSLEREVYRTLRITTKNLRKELRKKIEDHGITWQQFHAVYHIGEDGIKSNELAKQLQCNASNMTGLVDRMTENGWVYRERSNTDRRVWMVKLTEDGRDLKDKLFPQHKENINIMMKRLTEEELVTLQKLLGKLDDGSCKGD